MRAELALELVLSHIIDERAEIIVREVITDAPQAEADVAADCLPPLGVKFALTTRFL